MKMQSCPAEHHPLHSASRRQPRPGNRAHCIPHVYSLCGAFGNRRQTQLLCVDLLSHAPSRSTVCSDTEGGRCALSPACQGPARPPSYKGVGGSRALQRELLWGPQPLLGRRQISDLLLDGPVNCGVAAAQLPVRPGGWKSRGPCGAAGMDKPNSEGQGDSAWTGSLESEGMLSLACVSSWEGGYVPCFSGVMIFPLACPALLSQGLFAQVSPLALPGNLPF